MHNLTAKNVEHAAQKGKEYRLCDGKGLYLRVRQSGAKSWLFCYRLKGNRTLLQMTLGSTEDIGLKEARDIVSDFRNFVSKGIDPRTLRAAEIAENTQAITMQKLFDVWIDFVKVTDLMSAAWAKRHQDRWRLHLKQPLGNLLAKDITRSHLSAALEIMIRKGIKEETRKALTTLNLMFDYGLTRHSILTNPARTLKPKDFAASANQPRNRVLSLAELRKLWQVLDKSLNTTDVPTISVVTITAIKILILTGARRGEVAAMRYNELSLEEGIWKIPANKTKNRKGHTIYLGNLAIELIKNLRLQNKNSEYVFDSGRASIQGHIHQDTITNAVAMISKYLERDINSNSKFKPFCTHDIRRSISTGWGEYLKILPHVVERMLNHQPLNKLIATYQHARYLEEQRAAWLAWSKLVNDEVAR